MYEEVGWKVCLRVLVINTGAGSENDTVVKFYANQGAP